MKKLYFSNFTTCIFLILSCFSIGNTIAQPINNTVAGAIVLTHSANNCSANAAYGIRVEQIYSLYSSL